jgi:hypothetical protein
MAENNPEFVFGQQTFSLLVPTGAGDLLFQAVLNSGSGIWKKARLGNGLPSLFFVIP